LPDAVPHTSAHVAHDLQHTLAALEGCVQQQSLPARPPALTQGRKQRPARAALVDIWWHGVKQDVEACRLSPAWQGWVETCLLPLVDWEQHVAPPRGVRKKARLRQALEGAAPPCRTPPLTQQVAPRTLETWQAWALQRPQAFPRTSSAVEGRNGVLSQLHHNQRGLPHNRYTVWAVFHNFDCWAADGTTPAARCFQQPFPELFETGLPHMKALPPPRRRKLQRALSVNNCTGGPL
jgi:hypothetical protein